MDNLTLKNLMDFVGKCVKSGVPLDTPIFLGNDDELNGIHTGWFIQVVNKEGNSNDKTFIDMIEDDNCNIPTKDINILIS